VCLFGGKGTGSSKYTAINEDGKCVDGRGIAGGHTEGTKTSEKVRSVAGVRDGESSGGAVVGDREAKKLGGDWAGFGVVQGGETRDKKVKAEVITTKTKRIERETCLKRQGAEVS
jgi:hypothetical protein